MMIFIITLFSQIDFFSLNCVVTLVFAFVYVVCIVVLLVLTIVLYRMSCWCLLSYFFHGFLYMQLFCLHVLLYSLQYVLLFCCSFSLCCQSLPLGKMQFRLHYWFLILFLKSYIIHKVLLLYD